MNDKLASKTVYEFLQPECAVPKGSFLKFDKDNDVWFVYTSPMKSTLLCYTDTELQELLRNGIIKEVEKHT